MWRTVVVGAGLGAAGVVLVWLFGPTLGPDDHPTPLSVRFDRTSESACRVSPNPVRAGARVVILSSPMSTAWHIEISDAEHRIVYERAVAEVGSVSPAPSGHRNQMAVRLVAGRYNVRCQDPTGLTGNAVLTVVG